MPKKIDHEARRLELAEALWRINRTDGWDAISLRRVAAEAGVSMGMVQHYFTTKDEMLRFALEMINEDVRARVRARVAELPEPHTPRRLVWTVLSEMIPRPQDRESDADAAAVFVRRFQLRPESAAALAANNPDLRAFLADQIRLAAGEVQAEAHANTHADRDAGALIALLDGLLLGIVTGAETTESALEIIQAQLDHVFG